MKKVLFLFAAVLATAFVSCDKEDNAPIDTMATVGVSADIGIKGGLFPGLNTSGKNFDDEAFVSSFTLTLTPAPDSDPAAPHHNLNSDLTETISLSGNAASVIAQITALNFLIEAGKYDYSMVISNKPVGVVTAASGLDITSAATGTFTVAIGADQDIALTLTPDRAYISLDFIEDGDNPDADVSTDDGFWDLTGKLYTDAAVDVELFDSADITYIKQGDDNGLDGYVLPGPLTHDFVMSNTGDVGHAGDVTVNPFASSAPVVGTGVAVGKYYNLNIEFDAAAASVVTTLAAFTGSDITP